MRMGALLIGVVLAAPAFSPSFAKATEGGQDDKAAHKIELKGLWKVDGISFKQGNSTKYSGDTYLVMMAFSDENGKAWQPTPTLNFVVYNGNEPYKKVQRIVSK